jgi:hypothetical protein
MRRLKNERPGDLTCDFRRRQRSTRAELQENNNSSPRVNGMPAYAYTKAILQSLETAFSPARVDTYLDHVRIANAGATVEDALDLYIWNLQVSAAFQGPLHVLEVCLRNAMHLNLSLGFTADWIDDAKFIHVASKRSSSTPGRSKE